jgi:hypothetical protein
MKITPRVAPGLSGKSIVLLFTLLSLATSVLAQTPALQVSYGVKGVQTLSFGGVVLEDLDAFGGDTFHIWHIKSTDLSGNIIPGWGENTTSQAWNASSKTETYTFSWGNIATQFVQQGNTLNLIVTETNNTGSGIVFDGAEIYPFALHFPQDPAEFAGYTQQAVTTTGPGVSTADFGSGVVTNVLPDESIPMYIGWKNVGINTYSPMLTTTSPDELATFLPHNDRPVTPGSSFTFTVSLRFTAEGAEIDAADAYASFATQYPSQLNWTDRRILGTAYLASSPTSSGDSTQPGGFPTNPRRYFNDPSVDVTTAAGLRTFQTRILAQATALATNTQAMNGQGVITWDIEGEQYPQSTSYVCSPDQVATLAPEMESVISDPTSAYYGQKLDDAYFKTLTIASLKVGLCLRPQVFTRAADGSASQILLTTNASIVGNLENKARVANSRWGATIFYVDSTVDVNGGTLDPAIFQQLITDLPGFLFIPEESTPRYFAYTAPFYSFIFHTTVGTPTETYKMYPHAFGANLINDVSASTLAAYQPQLTQAVAKGDILMGHADYWQANDPTLVAIYRAAGMTTTPAPTLVTPAVSWDTPAAIVYGTPLSAAQLNATSNALGTFTYSPAAGSLLPAGTTTLLATFTPADPTSYSSTPVSVSLNVAQAAPVVNWAAPATIAAGTELGPTQLNATASVPGNFIYNPAAGVVLPTGITTLQADFIPSDTLDYQADTATVPLTVAAVVPKVPALAWSSPAAIVYGSILDTAQLNATANVPGTFTYSPAAGAVLSAGINILHAGFTPADAVHYTAGSATVSMSVQQAISVLAWGTPAAITYGTLLNATQLNATASTSGSFNYSFGPGSLLNAGLNTLQLSFSPADRNNYRAATATVQINVLQAKPAITWNPPAPIAVGTKLGSSELNATANVPGTVSYSPSYGATLPAGTQTLNATFYPSDTTNYSFATATNTLTVTAVTTVPPSGNLVILSPLANADVSGLITVKARCLLNLDPAGSYLMVDGAQVSQHRVSSGPFLYPLDTTTLSNGIHTLQLWAHDIGNNTTLSPIVVLQVAN